MRLNKANGLLSVILPCYNEEQGIAFAVDRIREVLEKTEIEYEMIFVSDGSKDRTFEIVQEFSMGDPQHIKGVAFSRNFGKEAAMLAGMQFAKGDCAVVLDSDMQQPPECIPEMYELWQQGFDIVEGIKEKRQKESVFHRILSNLFYKLFNLAIGMEIGNASDFKLIDRRVINTLLRLPERQRFFRGLTFWTGFRMTTITYQVQPRKTGVTKWSFGKLVGYALHNIISFSSLPLHIITIVSGIMLVCGLIFGIRAIRLYLTGLAAGGITTVVFLILMTGGFIMMALSIVGQYIASIYNELKGRPPYLVDRTTEEGMEECAAHASQDGNGKDTI